MLITYVKNGTNVDNSSERVQIESHLKTILSIAAIVVVLIVLRRRKNS
ncbi:MAG: hypothetical protein ACLRIT_12365 [Blautia sp.]